MILIFIVLFVAIVNLVYIVLLYSGSYKSTWSYTYVYTCVLNQYVHMYNKVKVKSCDTTQVHNSTIKCIKKLWRIKLHSIKPIVTHSYIFGYMNSYVRTYVQFFSQCNTFPHDHDSLIMIMQTSLVYVHRWSYVYTITCYQLNINFVV